MKIRRLPTGVITTAGLILIMANLLWSNDKNKDNNLKANQSSDSSMVKVPNSNSVPSNRGLVDKYGIPNEVEGNLSAGLKSTDIKDAAFEYFQNHKITFKIEDAYKEFRFEGIIHDKLVRDYQVRLNQIVNGVLVESGQYRLMFDQNQKLKRVFGQIDPEAKLVNTNPAISEEQVKSMVIKDMEKVKIDWPENAQTEIKKATLIIRRIDGELKLVWGISVIKGYNGYGYWIDAQNGKIIESGPSLIK